MTETALDQQSPEQHRQRYDALRAQAQGRATGRPVIGCPPIPAGRLLGREIIPGGWYWSAVIPRGMALRVLNPTGRASVAALVWNAQETSERLSVADTAKVQWTVRAGAGSLLLSDMGRALAAIIGDAGGRHDMLAGGSTRATNANRYGPGAWRNTQDNFRLAVAKHGLGIRDIPPCITLFADVRLTDGAHLAWHGPAAPGAAIDLRAEMDVLVALSNVPHPLDPAPSYAPPAIEALLWDPGPPAADDPCRTGGPEAVRAMENTASAWHG